MTSEHRVPLVLRVSGELVVIVVGVLIALWVDNLNEERQEGVQEAAYLGGILIDLRTDSVELRTREATAVRGIAAADRLLGLRRDPALTAPADSLARWFLHTAFVDNFQTLDHTYREILGAGGLRLIRDDSLRRSISDYYRSIESAEFFTEYYKGEEVDYYDLLAQRLAADDFQQITRSDDGLDLLRPSRLLALLRSDDELANAISMNRHWSDLRLDITRRRLAANLALSEALRSHLQDR